MDEGVEEDTDALSLVVTHACKDSCASQKLGISHLGTQGPLQTTRICQSLELKTAQQFRGPSLACPPPARMRPERAWGGRQEGAVIPLHPLRAGLSV